MNSQLKEVRAGGWRWHLKDAALLEPWFSDFERLMRENPVKANEVRCVFRVCGAGKGIYVKYYLPKFCPCTKIFLALFPKAERECASYLLLDECGVPSVRALGWGACGSGSMLLTEEMPESRNAKEFWFSRSAEEAGARGRFIAGLEDILAALIRAGIYLPDLHLGNLLVSGKEMRIAVVDPYGAKMHGSLSGAQIFSMLRVVGALRGELSEGEGAAVISRISEKAGTALQDPSGIWRQILQAESAEAEKDWRKRGRQVAAGDPRFMETHHLEGLTIRIRKNLAGEPLADLDDILRKDGIAYIFKECGAGEAAAVWNETFHNDFRRIPHTGPAAWITGGADHDTLVFAKGQPLAGRGQTA